MKNRSKNPEALQTYSPNVEEISPCFHGNESPPKSSEARRAEDRRRRIKLFAGGDGLSGNLQFLSILEKTKRPSQWQLPLSYYSPPSSGTTTNPITNNIMPDKTMVALNQKSSLTKTSLTKVDDSATIERLIHQLDNVFFLLLLKKSFAEKFSAHSDRVFIIFTNKYSKPKIRGNQSTTTKNLKLFAGEDGDGLFDNPPILLSRTESKKKSSVRLKFPFIKLFEDADALFGNRQTLLAQTKSKRKSQNLSLFPFHSLSSFLSLLGQINMAQINNVNPIKRIKNLVKKLNFTKTSLIVPPASNKTAALPKTEDTNSLLESLNKSFTEKLSAQLDRILIISIDNHSKTKGGKNQFAVAIKGGE